MGEQIKSSLLLMPMQYVYSCFSFHVPAIQLFISTWEKSYEEISYSAIHGSVITGSIVLKRLMTDSQYLDTNLRHYLKTGTLCLLFLSSHVFTTLQLDSNCFSILLWKIVKPRGHNETEPSIGKIFRKYKRVRHYFVMSRK